MNKTAPLKVVPKLDLTKFASKNKSATIGDAQKEGIPTPDSTQADEHPASVTSAELDLETNEEPEDMDPIKELNATEKKIIKAAVSILAGKKVAKVKIADGQAQFYSVDNPDDAPDMATVEKLVDKSYPDNLSQNNAEFFQVDEKKAPVVTAAQLNKIVMRATEIGARNAVSAVFNQLKQAGYKLVRAGVEEANQTNKKTDIQKEIEDSVPPTDRMAKQPPYERAEPSDIDALERVDMMPFDEFEPTSQTKGRQISRVPAES